MKNSKQLITKLNSMIGEIYDESVSLSEKIGMTPSLKEVAHTLSDLLDASTTFEKNPTSENYLKCGSLIIQTKNKLKIIH